MTTSGKAVSFHDNGLSDSNKEKDTSKWPLCVDEADVRFPALIFWVLPGFVQQRSDLYTGKLKMAI